MVGFPEGGSSNPGHGREVPLTVGTEALSVVFKFCFSEGIIALNTTPFMDNRERRPHAKCELPHSLYSRHENRKMERRVKKEVPEDQWRSTKSE